MTDGSKAEFGLRIAALNLNVDALNMVELFTEPITGEKEPHVIPNAPKKQGSLQVYAAITTNDGYIKPEQAKRGLDIFGEEYRKESKQNHGLHPNIEFLEQIVEKDITLRADVIRKSSFKQIPEHVLAATYELLKSKDIMHATPFHIYDTEGIIQSADKLNTVFEWANEIAGGFKEYAAVKAFPSPANLKIQREMGNGADCSSAPELILANDWAGITGENIMFTSNNTKPGEFALAHKYGAIINLDDISHIKQLEAEIGGFPELICFRYNPGPARVGNSIIGNPSEAKYGLTKPQIFEALKIAKQKGAKRFGLHTMVASNELNPDYFVETAGMMFDLAAEVKKDLGINIEFVNLGGGIGIPYKPEQREVPLSSISLGIKEAYLGKIKEKGLMPLKIMMENGRYMTGPHGYLVSKVIHKKDIYRKYVGLDASMQNLMRPALYNAYHHITVLGKEDMEPRMTYDVTGSLCENNDKFAINRRLPQIDEGDVIVIHDTGAHGWTMGFNYNGKLRSAEFLADKLGKAHMIRRPETVDDYFATLKGF